MRSDLRLRLARAGPSGRAPRGLMVGAAAIHEGSVLSLVEK
jgi:hypothetical protein